MRKGDESLYDRTLIAYEQEFGADKVVAILPKSWADRIDPKKFLPYKLESWDLAAVGIRVTNASANFILLII